MTQLVAAALVLLAVGCHVWPTAGQGRLEPLPGPNSGTKPTLMTLPTQDLTPSTPTTTPALPACPCTMWTPWINSDADPSDGGDFETVGYDVAVDGHRPGRVTVKLAAMGIVCNNPIMAECREVGTHAVWHTVGDNTNFPRRINCDHQRGLVCNDTDQADGACHDYEIRLKCWVPCEEPRIDWHPAAFYDKDNPSGVCDCELPGWFDHPARHAPPCPDGKSPLDVECLTVTGAVPAALTSDQRVTCSVSDGFRCDNANQPSGSSCKDYKVRYLCHL